MGFVSKTLDRINRGETSSYPQDSDDSKDKSVVDDKSEPVKKKGRFAELLHDLDDEEEIVTPEKETIEADDKLVDWEERHFRVCLAMLSNPSIAKVASAATEAMIIRRADAMISRLKEHYKENPLGR